ncbi:MAG: P-loop NTPase fold protein [Bacteroidota bacterium]|nr:P-loop NTPase fold protein [Bacteroidota bacterium]
MSEEKVIELSEEILQFLLDYKRKRPGFTFWLRNKDSVQSSSIRLQKGYWFQGNDEYIFLSFYKKGDKNNRTRSIGFVIVFDEEENPECYLEVVWGSEQNNSEQLTTFYENVCKTLNADIEVHETKYQKYYGDDVISSLKIFLEKDKQIIDELIISHGLNVLFVIDEGHFQKMLTNTSIYRNALKGSGNIAHKPNVEKVSISRKHVQYSINEPEDGVIGVKDLAEEVAKIVSNLGGIKRGNMFGVFGQWGIGKTFLMDEAWKVMSLKGSDHFERVSFHAWKYQDTPASWAYLYEEFSKKYFEEKKEEKENVIFYKVRRKYHQLRKSILLNIQRSGWTPLIKTIFGFVFLSGLVALLIRNGSLVYDPKDKTIIGIAITGTIAFGISAIKYISEILFSINTKAKALFDKYYQKPNMKGHLGVQAEIQSELKSLLLTWIVTTSQKKIVLFVDDIDRCSEDQIIRIIDALRIMLEDEEIAARVIVIAAIDERILKRAIQCKYHDLMEKDYSLKHTVNDTSSEKKNQVVSDLIREYMDKLFISGIKLSSLTLYERKEIFRAFAHKYTEGYDNKINVEEGEEEEYTEIDSENDSMAKRKDSLPKPDEVSIAEELSINIQTKFELTKAEYDAIQEFLALYAQATPRQIKILYYRYQLARNIFSKIFPSIKIEPEGHIQNLILLIIEYTKGISTLHNLSEVKERINDCGENSISVTIMGSNVSMPTDYALSLFKVIEMVVAY